MATIANFGPSGTVVLYAVEEAWFGAVLGPDGYGSLCGAKPRMHR